jgi:hypothetical protein
MVQRAAVATFAADAEVSDRAGCHATGAAQVRQWLQVGALAEFCEHVVGTLEVVRERVTWVDMLADADESTRPVRVAATVQNGKIRTFVSTDLGPRRAARRGLLDLAAPLVLGLLVPVIGWLGLRAVLSLTLRGAGGARQVRPKQPTHRQQGPKPGHFWVRLFGRMPHRQSRRTFPFHRLREPRMAKAAAQARTCWTSAVISAVSR